MRVVFDTVVLVRGLIGPYSQWGKLIFERRKEYQWVVSPEIVAEYLDVLHRPELIRKYREAETRNLLVLLSLIESALLVEPAQVPAICRDPDDDKFLAAASVGMAECLVTEDADLLAVGTYEGTVICSAQAFLRRLDMLNANGKRTP